MTVKTATEGARAPALGPEERPATGPEPAAGPAGPAPGAPATPEDDGVLGAGGDRTDGGGEPGGGDAGPAGGGCALADGDVAAEPARPRAASRGAGAAEPRARGAEAGWLSRRRMLTGVLALLTLIALYLCARIALPFVPPLAWALAIAIVTKPLHGWIAARVRYPNLSAGLAVGLVAVVLVGPAIFVTQTLVSQAAVGFQHVRETAPQRWQQVVDRNPRLAPMLRRVQEQAQGQLSAVAGAVGSQASSLLAGGAWVVAQIGVTLFFLFFFFRDRDAIVRGLCSLLPVSTDESRLVLGRVVRTIHATVYGSLAVALVQGTLGGFMFWILGLPGPLLWGSVMAVLAVVPVLGTFVVWAPAAAYLALSGDWVRALVLAGWGCTAIALVDNLLYPVLVGKDLELHTIPVFVSLVGGIALFGMSGLILGPMTLAVTLALLDVWRGRTRGGQAAEAAPG